MKNEKVAEFRFEVYESSKKKHGYSKFLVKCFMNEEKIYSGYLGSWLTIKFERLTRVFGEWVDMIQKKKDELYGKEERYSSFNKTIIEYIEDGGWKEYIGSC